MPIYRITIVLEDGKTFDEYRDSFESDLNTFYYVTRGKAENTFGLQMSYFDAIQIADVSYVARYMREKGWSKMKVRDYRIAGSGDVAYGGRSSGGVRIP